MEPPVLELLVLNKIMTVGISGVSPNSKLISISINLNWGNTPQQLANGFNWAWQNGSDVISNSWGGYAPSNIINNAIANALSQGRNGLGCVLVFCTHNDDGIVAYPASLPNVIGVGAISPNGERKSPSSCDRETWWGSNYGEGLDVISTTTWTGGYTQTFNGTSAATPHVAGVATLILSVNPSLTTQQARNISESKAQKVNRQNLFNPTGYMYSTTPGHPNGT
jgi:subtilisin family serine protease